MYNKQYIFGKTVIDCFDDHRIKNLFLVFLSDDNNGKHLGNNSYGLNVSECFYN